MSLRALIVGCGQAAGGFDAARPDSADPLTHAGAYRRDARFTLAACVEPDEARRQAFMQRWDVATGFAGLAEAGRPGSFDVISICSPTSGHERDLRQAIALKPKLIFCEKPVTPSAAQTEALVRACRQAGVLLAVNYTRRWDPEVVKLKDDLHASRRGKLRAVAGWYNKGLLNNGSHMLDLLLLLLGPLRVLKAGAKIDDFSAEDPTVPAWLETGEGVPVQLAGGCANDFAIFELELLFSNAMLAMEDGGMAWRERAAMDSTLFAGYRGLDAGTRRAGGYAQAMRLAMDNVAEAIGRGAPLASSGETALAAQRLCEEVMRYGGMRA
jgi:predicted dehydrogenase